MEVSSGPFVKDIVLNLILIQAILWLCFPCVNCRCFVAEVLEIVEVYSGEWKIRGKLQWEPDEAC